MTGADREDLASRTEDFLTSQHRMAFEDSRRETIRRAAELLREWLNTERADR